MRPADIGAKSTPAIRSHREGVALPMVGIVAFYRPHLERAMSTQHGRLLDDRHRQQPRPERPTRSTAATTRSANLMHYPVPNVMFGPEVQWDQRENNTDDFDVDDIRIQFSAKYNFSIIGGGQSCLGKVIKPWSRSNVSDSRSRSLSLLRDAVMRGRLLVLGDLSWQATVSRPAKKSCAHPATRSDATDPDRTRPARRQAGSRRRVLRRPDRAGAGELPALRRCRSTTTPATSRRGPSSSSRPRARTRPSAR